MADLSQTLQQPKGALDVVSVRLHGHEVCGSGGLRVLPAVASADPVLPSTMCKGGEMLREWCKVCCAHEESYWAPHLLLL